MGSGILSRAFRISIFEVGVGFSVTLKRSGRVPNPGFYGASRLQNDRVESSREIQSYSCSGSWAVSLRLRTKIADTIAAAIRYIGGTISLSVLSIK